MMEEAHKKIMHELGEIKKHIYEMHEKMKKALDHMKHCEEHEKSGKCKAHKD